jgi:hypothetical protein
MAETSTMQQNDDESKKDSIKQGEENKNPVVWEVERDKDDLFKRDRVTEKDKFEYATRTLLPMIIGMYFIIGAAKCMYGEVKGVETVWQVSSIFFQSVMMLVIGSYFGKK